jgi:hypothetical protein
MDDLHGTTDAQVWAREFVKTLREHPDTADPADESFMVGWFANAIGAGEIAATSGEKVALSREELCGLVFEAAGAATGPLLRDNPGYVFPADEVSELVARVIEEKTEVRVADVPGYAGVGGRRVPHG